MPHKKAPVSNKAGHEDSGIICSHHTFSCLLGFMCALFVFHQNPGAGVASRDVLNVWPSRLLLLGHGHLLWNRLLKQLADLPDLHFQETSGSALRISWDFGTDGWNINSRASLGRVAWGLVPQADSGVTCFLPEAPAAPTTGTPIQMCCQASWEVVNVTRFFPSRIQNSE